MTTIASDVGQDILDLSVDSVELKGRAGETIVYEQQFFEEIVYTKNGNIDYNNSTSLSIEDWTFEAGIRDGSFPNHLEMDVKKYGPNGISNNSSYILSFDTSQLQTPITANSQRPFYFEVQATIPLGDTDSEGNEIMDKQTVLVGIMTLASNIYMAPLP